jgi:hypothetical protein
VAHRRLYRPRIAGSAWALGVVLALGACATGSKAAHVPGQPSDDRGTKILQAVVTEREYASPGSSAGGSYAGSGTWYLSFEVQDGDRTEHYRFPVTRNQYFRYTEGTRVRLVLLDDQLHDIRPDTEK